MNIKHNFKLFIGLIDFFLTFVIYFSLFLKERL